MKFLRRGSDLARAAQEIVADGDDAPVTGVSAAAAAILGGDDTQPGDDTAPGGGGEDTLAGGASTSVSASANEADIRADERTKERARVSEVFASEHCKGREAAAVCLLTETDMPADKIVAKLPTLSPAASASPNLARLAEAPNPDLGAGSEAGGDAPKPAARILSAQAAMKGGKRTDASK